MLWRPEQRRPTGVFVWSPAARWRPVRPHCVLDIMRPSLAPATPNSSPWTFNPGVIVTDRDARTARGRWSKRQTA